MLSKRQGRQHLTPCHGQCPPKRPSSNGTPPCQRPPQRTKRQPRLRILRSWQAAHAIMIMNGHLLLVDEQEARARGRQGRMHLVGSTPCHAVVQSFSPTRDKRSPSPKRPGGLRLRRAALNTSTTTIATWTWRHVGKCDAWKPNSIRMVGTSPACSACFGRPPRTPAFVTPLHPSHRTAPNTCAHVCALRPRPSASQLLGPKPGGNICSHTALGHLTQVVRMHNNKFLVAAMQDAFPP